MSEGVTRRSGGREARLGRRARPQEAAVVAPELLVTTSANPEGPVLVLACGAIANEVIALRQQLGVSDEAMVLHCLPAELHNRPGQIAPRVDAFLSEHRHKYSRVLLGYGDCGTGGALDKVLARHEAGGRQYALFGADHATNPYGGDTSVRQAMGRLALRPRRLARPEGLPPPHRTPAGAVRDAVEAALFSLEAALFAFNCS